MDEPLFVLEGLLVYREERDGRSVLTGFTDVYYFFFAPDSSTL